ncbi:hypothetical protein ABIA33_000792 [Streptacidiphilus sp. MAP12-16]|uniref:hypothetical protein n=1 Tax=Streptacidiphilus sp. MAP12-16 TaxID=3156300 RepID=UPI003519BF22
MVNRQSTCRQGVRAVLVAAAAAGLLAGCAGAGSSAGTGAAEAAAKGGSSDTLAADPLTAVRAAADVTGRTGSVQDATTLQTASSAKQMTLHGTAVYNYSARLGRMEIAVPAAAGTPGKQLVEVISPGVVYLQNSGAKVPAGKWVKVGVQQLADGNLVSSGATDPASAANALRGALTATQVGTETVGGVPLKHYKGTLDLARAAGATGGGAASGLALAGHTFTVKQVPYEVWLDEHGRIHRIVETFTFSGVPSSTAAKDQVVVTSTTEFSGFGTPVKVDLPPSKDVYGAQQSK